MFLSILEREEGREGGKGEGEGGTGRERETCTKCIL